MDMVRHGSARLGLPGVTRLPGMTGLLSMNRFRKLPGFRRLPEYIRDCPDFTGFCPIWLVYKVWGKLPGLPEITL